MTLGKAVRRFFLDVGIAIALLVLVFLAVVLMPGRVLEFSGQWLALATCTGLLLWIIIRQSGLYLRRPAFWFAVACLLVVHFLVFVAIFYAFPPSPLRWYMIITFVESGCFGVVLFLLFGVRQRRHTGRRHEWPGKV